MTHHEIVKRLIGPIVPVGETMEDGLRFSNLVNMTNLVDHLLVDIDYVSSKKSREEFSIKKAGEFASKFQDQMGIVE